MEVAGEELNVTDQPRIASFKHAATSVLGFLREPDVSATVTWWTRSSVEYEPGKAAVGFPHRDAAAVDVRVEVGDPQLDAMTDADGRQTACANVPAQRGLAGVPPGSSLGDGDDGRTLAGSRHDGPLLSVRNEHLVGLRRGLTSHVSQLDPGFGGSP